MKNVLLIIITMLITIAAFSSTCKAETEVFRGGHPDIVNMFNEGQITEKEALEMQEKMYPTIDVDYIEDCREHAFEEYEEDTEEALKNALSDCK